MTEVEAQMKPRIDTMDQQLKFLMNNIAGTHLFSQGVLAGTPQSDSPLCDQPHTRSSCHSVDTYPVATIKTPKRCSLAICLDGKSIVVAKGMAHPTTDETLVNRQPLFHNCVRVWVDDVIEGREQFNLPMPDQQYVTIVDVIGNFVQWPMHLVTLDEICNSMLKRNATNVISYFIHVMEQNKDKQFILAPYHQESHWLLLVICMRSKSVCFLDPLPSDRDNGEIKASINLAFRSVPTNGRIKNIDWKPCKCPIQPGDYECGYYVMRYMFDIVTKYSSIDDLDKAFESDSPYSINDINEIREQWAKYFFSETLTVTVAENH
ncbi:PREDICTED: uncharacterized protein LOC109183794 [Ipomoea nil]|uniref:uncharacterized protein LOC109183794 n=1 Tax=Ipomoea nil TaxID=35883 RepID=UPI0009009410|nr:PREDICTED: uncharacterized protein LOC109183794 [Ipomoea nil]